MAKKKTEIKERICEGCGEVLQFENPKAKGYIPEEIYKRGNLNYCRRCFRLQHYNEDDTDFMPSDTISKILYDAKLKNAMFIYIIDLFNFETTFNRKVNNAIKGSTVILLANKRDVLCKSFKDENIKKYILRRAKEAGLVAKDVIIMSARKNYNIDEVKATIDKYSDNKDIYVIGAASSGKSTFINKFLKNYTNNTNRVITTSCYPGTTSKIIEIPLSDSQTIYDTPGLDSSHSMISVVEKEVVKMITPTKEIKPITLQMSKGNMFMIGNLARVEFVDGPKTGVTIYISSQVDIHRSRISKVDELKKSLIERKRIKPISKNVNGLKMHKIVETHDCKRDIIIAGLCWISYNGKGQTFKVYAPNEITVLNYDAKFVE